MKAHASSILVIASAIAILVFVGSQASANSYQYSICNDTDGGQNFYVKGDIVRLGAIVWSDNCLNPSQVQEGYCDSNARMGWKVINYECQDSCYKGACQLPLNAKVYVSTTTTSSTTMSLRSTSSTLYWYTSTSTLPSQKTTTTMATTTTLQGSAVSQAQITPQIVQLFANIRCIDSDGGINYFVKGFTLKNTTMTSTQIWYDTCLNPSQLQEGYCDKSRRTGLRVLIYSCPLGCYAGACVQGPSTTTTTTTTSTTTTLKTGCAQDSDCVRCGDKCISLSSNGLVAIECLSSPLAGCLCIGGACVPVTITTTTTATTTTTLETTITTLPSGQTTTSTTTTTTLAGVVPQVVTLFGTNTCTDTDGGLNYYLKGYIYLNSTYTSRQVWYDYCLSPSILQEAYCDKAKRAGYRPVTFNCPNGCEAGACKAVKNPSPRLFWQTTSTTQPQ